jgi:type II secretory pathway pseudopilin PulG
LERLKEWLSSWKAKLSKEASSSLNTSRSSAYDSDSDYTCSDSDFSNSESGTSNGRKFYPNAILLSGPHGSGKTSSVYSAAKLLGFKVFEVNSSNLRGKSQILQELDGVLNSHHVSSNPNASTTSTANAISSFFSNAKAANAKKPSLPMFPTQKQGATTATTTPNENKINKFFKLNASKSTDVLTSDKAADKTALEKNETIVTKKPRNKRKNSLRRETVLSSHKRNKSKKALMEIDCDTDSTITVDESDTEEDQVDEKGTVKCQSDSLLLNENSNSNSVSSSNAVTVHKESLILFDEIDVVTHIEI